MGKSGQHRREGIKELKSAQGVCDDLALAPGPDHLDLARAHARAALGNTCVEEKGQKARFVGIGGGLGEMIVHQIYVTQRYFPSGEQVSKDHGTSSQPEVERRLHSQICGFIAFVKRESQAVS